MKKIVTLKEAREKNLPRYYTGRPCKHGHLSERRTKGGKCVECDRETSRQYQNADRERCRRIRRESYRAHKEERCARANERYRLNIDGFADYHAAYREKHKEKRNAVHQEYYLANRERLQEYSKQYAKLNRHKTRGYGAKRYAAKKQRMLATDTEFSKFVIEEAAHLCIMREEVTGFRWEIDHMVPLLSRTACGLHTWANLQCLPKKWNNWKRNRMFLTEPHQWLRDERLWSNV